jgi:outer membrane receptor protein involved in Fe transport
MGDGITNVGSLSAIGETVENKFQLGNNLTMVKSRHILKVGGQVTRYQQNRYYAGNNGALGFFDYSTGKYTSDSFADFLLNQLSEKGRGSVTGKWGHRHARAGIFFQDDWKVASNLTINLGMRWEYTQPVYEVADRQSNFDLTTGKQLFAGKDGNSRALFNAYYKQFMPRIGIAWQPRSKFVVRGGYAIISFLEATGANLRLPLNPPFFFESDTVFDLNKPGDIRTGFTDVTPLNVPSGNVRAWDPNLRPQFTQQWNISVEHQFTNALSVTAAYVGQKATHLVVPREGNQPLPGTGPVSTWAPLQTRRPLYAFIPLVTTIAVTDSPATMDYHALQMTARKSMSHGLEFVASYTYGKTLTDNRGFYGGGGFIAGEGAYWQNAYNRTSERGRSFFDARHNFTVGGTWDVPVGQGRKFAGSMSRVADLIVGGWSSSFLVVAHSGFPVTILGRDNTNQAVRGNVRANRYRPLTYTNQSIDNWFGTGNTFCTLGVDDGKCAYGDAALGLFGNTAIGTEQAPSFFDLDGSIGKRFKLAEKKALDFRTEFFNLMNHTSFGPPGRSLATPATFGVITSQTTPSRNIQFGLKLMF